MAAARSRGTRILLAVVLGAASCSALPSALSLQRPGSPARQPAPMRPGGESGGRHVGALACAGAPGAGMRLRGGADVMATAAALNPETAKQLLNSGLISQPRKIGFALIAVGIILSFLGFMLFLNKTLIGTGNIFVVAGVVLAVGWKKSKDFMFQRQRARGSSIFLFGLYLVLRGWARLGVLVEFFGILNLFGNFLPSLVNLIKKLPVVGPVLAPILDSPVFEKCMGYASKMAATTGVPADGTVQPPRAGAPPPAAGVPPVGKADGGYDWAGVLRKGQAYVSGYTKTGQATPAAGAGAPPYGGVPPGYGGAPPPGYGGAAPYGAAPQGAGYGGVPPSHQAPPMGQPPGYGYGGPPPGPGGGPPGAYGGYPPPAGGPPGTAPPLRQQAPPQQPQGRKKTWNEIQKEQLQRMSQELDRQGGGRPPAGGGGWGGPPGYGNKPPGY